MTATTTRDWSDVAATANELAGNWQKFECFCWHRRHDLPDAANWMIFYTSSPQSGLIELSNQKVMTDQLAIYAEGERLRPCVREPLALGGQLADRI